MNDNNSDLYVKITQIAKADESLQPRLNELKNFFHEEFGNEPEFFVKVPGRVNIIGEHVDYCGYPVLPMAIQQCFILAVSTNTEGLLYLRNLNRKYANYKCDLKSLSINLPAFGSPPWYNYFLCGIKGVFDHLNNVLPESGITVAISGNVPPASGLSSSSALVSAAVLVTAYISAMPLNRRTLASISASCERYIGTQGGGMDQAIAYLAKKGCAQFIEFYPELSASSVKLPVNASFVIANSLAEINKAATSDFNERVVECRLACSIIAKELNLTNWKEIKQFAVLQSALNCNLNEMEKYAQDILIKDEYSRTDILLKLNISDDELSTKFLTTNTMKMNNFSLRQRALHVIQESIRVRKFQEICEKNNSNLNDLSKLMQESHNSLRYLYECSHSSLDCLVDLSKSMGIGARLTGAGWGGCIVALCDSVESSNKFIAELKDKYYKNLPQAKTYNIDDLIFATCPQNGAEIFYAKENK